METVQVHTDSHMTAIKLDEEAGFPPEKAVNITVETADETIAETSTGDMVVPVAEAPFDEPCGGFGSGLMELCTLGFKGNETASLAEPKDQEITPELIVQDLVNTESQLKGFEDESDFKKTDETANTSIVDIRQLSLIAPAAPSDEDSQGKSANTQDTILSRVVQNLRRRNTICLYTLAIFVFLIMAGLFIAGGIFFSKNGW